MSSLRDSQAALHDLLRGKLPSSEAAQRLQASEQRLTSYRSFVAHHVLSVLAKHYTVLADLLPADTWAELARSYYHSHPPSHHELNQAAAQFVSFLGDMAQSRPELRLTTAHVEMAELEWQEWEAYASRAELPQAKQLNQPALNPTLQVCQFEYPVATFIDAYRVWQQTPAEHRSAAPPVPTRPQAQIVFVVRHPHHLFQVFHVADDNLLFAFKVVHDGLTVAQAATAGGVSESQVRDVLEHADHCGVVLLPR